MRLEDRSVQNKDMSALIMKQVELANELHKVQQDIWILENQIQQWKLENQVKYKNRKAEYDEYYICREAKDDKLLLMCVKLAGTTLKIDFLKSVEGVPYRSLEFDSSRLQNAHKMMSGHEDHECETDSLGNTIFLRDYSKSEYLLEAWMKVGGDLKVRVDISDLQNIAWLLEER